MTIKPLPLTRQQLDRMKCGHPNCNNPDCEGGPVWLHGQCHPVENVIVEYEDAVVIVSCAKCKQFIAQILAAQGELHGGPRWIYCRNQNHPEILNTPKMVKYEDGTLTITCTKCKQTVKQITVASVQQHLH